MRLLTILIICLSSFLVAIPINAAEVSEEWLLKVKAQLQKNIDTINELENEVLKLSSELEVAYDKIHSQRAGLFLGGNINYPLPSANAILLYRAANIMPYIIGGYNNGFSIGIGILCRFKVGR